MKKKRKLLENKIPCYDTKEKRGKIRKKKKTNRVKGLQKMTNNKNYNKKWEKKRK